MFRIRRIYDDTLPLNRDTLKQVKGILRARFSSIPEEEIEGLGERLRNPFRSRFRSILLAAENMRGRVLGFALLLHEPELEFCFLDWIATLKGGTGGGVGGALYEGVRREASALKVEGLFFECLPDDENLCGDKTLLKENRARLRFYERYGARPIVGAGYEAPVNESDTCMPHLVYDGLDRSRRPGAHFMKQVVRAILERKYAGYCPPEYVEKVVESFTDSPIALRELRYVKPEAVKSEIEGSGVEKIALVVNDHHGVHHVHERGYVESPVRIKSIAGELERSGLFDSLPPKSFPDRHLYSVHDRDFCGWLKKACIGTTEGKSLYPYVFPIRNKTRPPRELSVLAGYYCIDTFTPINNRAYPAARRAVDCALTAARWLVEGGRISYALVRPPGHHAERRSFGGFCYFNNNAVAANYLSAYGSVAILDIDYHHGNGQQDIFYGRSDILTVSIHGHPRFAYPYFSGFPEERGEGDGEGFNLNLPLPEQVDGEKYRAALARALRRIEVFGPDFLVVALGLDTAKSDPTGTWSLQARDYDQNGRMIGGLGLPVVVIQEGGYRTRTLGVNARNFFSGLAPSSSRAASARRVSRNRLEGVAFRTDLKETDVNRIRALVEKTGFFRPGESAVAEEVASERISRHLESGYHFVLAEQYGRLVGYICYGPIPCTVSGYDIYWLAVDPEFQGRGLGKRLLRNAERSISEAGGTKIYVETSSRVQYAGTRAFYETCGYVAVSVIDDFYEAEDGKITYLKNISGSNADASQIPSM
jgi:acetoin utilization deacetylase AcuC-like enzyme/ribosomal protein S18 acetylase RimI-like enzyme